MQNPIEQLRDAVNGMPESMRGDFVLHACFAIGKSPERTEVPFDYDTPIGELYHDLTVDDLCDAVRQIVERRGILAQVLISGLFDYVASWHERCADREISNQQLDHSLGMLEQMESELVMPVDDRRIPISDDHLRKMIQMLKDGMVRGPKFKEECLDRAASIRSAAESAFPALYWHEWYEYEWRHRNTGTE